MKLITGNPGNGSWVPVPDSDTTTQSSDQPLEKNVWLFNITSDPNEHNDLSDKLPGVVHSLLSHLLQINNTAVPPRYPKNDKRSDPGLRLDVWGPWE